jgi:hypothetical protein
MLLGKERQMRIIMAWVAAGCLVICLLALVGDSLLSTGWSWLGSPAVAGVPPRLRMTDAMTSLINENHSYGYYSLGRLPGHDAVLAVGVSVVAGTPPRGTDPPEAVTVAQGSQTAAGTLGMLMLGSEGRRMDRQAVSSGDILLRRGDTVQDESASAATVSAPLARVESARHLVLLAVSALVFGDSAPAIPRVPWGLIGAMPALPAGR